MKKPKKDLTGQRFGRLVAEEYLGYIKHRHPHWKCRCECGNSEQLQNRKTGKWIYNSPVTMKCNLCGLVIKDWDWNRFDFCPACGVDMRGNQDENN